MFKKPYLVKEGKLTIKVHSPQHNVPYVLTFSLYFDVNLHHSIFSQFKFKLRKIIYKKIWRLEVNVDGSWTLKHDKKDATIINIEDFDTSGSIMKCLYRDTCFNQSSRNNNFEGLISSYEPQNVVFVPIEYFRKILGVDVYKYL